MKNLLLLCRPVLIPKTESPSICSSYNFSPKVAQKSHVKPQKPPKPNKPKEIELNFS
jgi:hypothetical protein